MFAGEIYTYGGQPGLTVRIGALNNFHFQPKSQCFSLN